jgi:O-antigen ligase
MGSPVGAVAHLRDNPRVAGRAQSRGQKAARSGRDTTVPVDRGAAAALWLLVLTILAVTVAVDPRASASFDAPKRLLGLVGVASAAIAAFAFARGPMSPSSEPGRSVAASDTVFRRALAAVVEAASALSWPRRVALGGVLVAAGWALLATVYAPHQNAAWDALRVVAVGSLLLPLGASRVVAGGRAVRLAAALVVGCAINAAICLLQVAGVFQPFEIAMITGRASIGALIGNEGYLALLLAFGAVLALCRVLLASAVRGRVAAGLVGALFVTTIVVTGSVTALLALAVGGIVVGHVLRRRMWRPVVLAAIVVSAGLMLVPVWRSRVAEVVGNARAGSWHRVLSERGGPWLAALEMVRAHPLAGVGLGGFAAEFVPYRLAAEIRGGTRLTTAKIYSSYGEAHCDPLQAAAELGLPAALALGAGVVALLVGLWRTALSGDQRLRPEAIVLLGFLVVGTVASLAWFPWQRPFTAIPLLLAAGRAWRISA